MATEVNSNLDSETIKAKNIESLSAELDHLHQYCVNYDIDAFRTLKMAKPFMKWQEKNRKRGYISTVFVLSVLVALFGVILCYEPVNRYVDSRAKYISILVSPYIDWSMLYGLRCFIPNPVVEDTGMDELQVEDCKTCSNITTIKQLQHVQMEELCETYLSNKIPLVLTNQNVYRRGKTSISDLMEMYLEDEILNLYTCCDFLSNIQKVRKDHRIFLTKLKQDKFSQYYAHWQNCFSESAKLFRKVYNRPAMLPSTVELYGYNWVFLSADYADDESIPVPFNASVVILLQISGYLDVIAEPNQLCQSECKNLGVRLQAQSILIAPTHLYNYKYRPCRKGQSITVGLEGSIDL